jgi:LPXTG-motif cell wall-anchored protein
MTPPPPPPGEGTIVVAKVVDGDGDAPAGDFGFTLVCADGTSETFTLGDGDDDTFTREGGFEGCEVTETDDLDADATSWAITGAVTDSGSGTATGDDPGFDVGEDQTATVTFTNTFDAPPPPPGDGTIIVAKVVDGDGDAPAGDFGFTLVCADGTSETFTLGDGDDDTFTREGGFEGCEVTETDDLDADATSWAITGAVTDSGSGTATGDDPGFDVGEDQTATVTFTNTFDAPPPPPGDGTIIVAKVVDGDGDAPAGDFGFTLVCADGTSETFTLGDGDDDTFTREGGFEGCEVTETDDLDADATSWVITGDVTSSGSGTATGDDPGFDVGENETATVTFTNTFDAPPPPPITNPDISLTKSAVAIAGDDLVPGELVEFNGDKIYTITPDIEGDVHTITYVFDITNTGDVTLFDVTLTDPMLGGDIEIEHTTLAPGDETTGTATYDLTDEDITAGTVPNTATVTGEDDEGTEVSDTDDETIDDRAWSTSTQLAPSISVVKDAIVDGITDDGEGNLLVTITGQDGTATVTYRYVVTNTGDDDLTDLTLIDDKIGNLTDELVAAVTAEYGGPVLPVDGQVTITAIHEVSASDFDGITLTNLVDVTGLGVDSGATVNDDDTETVVLIQVLDVVEEAEEAGATATRLPRTGLNSAGLTGLGLLLAMLGAATLLFTRRRHRAGRLIAQ